MSVDTFPELTPPVLVIGTQAPGLGPKRRREDHHLAHREVRQRHAGRRSHVESLSRNGLSVVYVWLKWGTDLNAAQTLVQQQVAFAMTAVPKSLGVHAPLRAAVRPVERARGPGRRAPAAASPARSSTTSPEQRRADRSRASRASRARRSTAAGSGRSTSSSTRSRAQARGLTSSDVAAAVARANALLPSGSLHHPDASTPTSTPTPSRAASPTSATRSVKVHDGQPGAAPRRRARSRTAAPRRRRPSRSTAATPSTSTCCACRAATPSPSSTR